MPDLAFAGRAGGLSGSTPLHVVADWISQSGFITPEGEGGFAFVTVEVAPWYHSREGMRVLDQEVLICGKTAAKFDKRRLTSMLDRYRDTVSQIQTLSLGPFLHPSFSGRDGAKDWAKAHFSFLQSPSTADELASDAERLRYKMWQEATEKLKFSRSIRPKSRKFPSFPGHMCVGLEKNSTKKLVAHAHTLPDRLADYTSRLVDDYNPGGLYSDIPIVELERDLDLTQGLVHERLRLAFQLDDDPGQAAIKTVFLGVSLRSLPDEEASPKERLPERYRGGVWVFAGTYGEFGPKQTLLLGDLARLTVLLENPAIDAKASDAIIKSQTGRYKALYDQPAIQDAFNAWNDGLEMVEAGRIFAAHSGHHDLAEWKAAIAGGKFPELQKRIPSLAKRIIKACIDRSVDLPLWPALVFLRGVYQGNLSASLAARILAGDDGLQIETNVDDQSPSFICADTDPHINSGLLLHALSCLTTSVPVDKKTMKPNGQVTKRRLWEPEDSVQPWALEFESQFDSLAIRDAAARNLWQRLDDRPRDIGQVANTACLLLGKASRRRTAVNGELTDDADIFSDQDSAKLRLVFHFRHSH